MGMEKKTDPFSFAPTNFAMDKYQKRMMRKMDEDRGRQLDTLEDICTLRRERKYIRAKMKLYTPCPANLIKDLQKLDHVSQWGNRFPPGFPSFMDELPQLIWDPVPTRSGVRTDFMNYPLWEYVWDRNALGIATRVNLPKTVDHFKQLVDDRYIWNHMLEFRRTMKRTKQIQEDLHSAHHRMQTILACHRIKEELYMDVYHPRRIEKLLETGGWEALENFAGL
jgi:hypothetical protein